MNKGKILHNGLIRKCVRRFYVENFGRIVPLQILFTAVFVLYTALLPFLFEQAEVYRRCGGASSFALELYLFLGLILFFLYISLLSTNCFKLLDGHMPEVYPITECSRIIGLFQFFLRFLFEIVWLNLGMLFLLKSPLIVVLLGLFLLPIFYIYHLSSSFLIPFLILDRGFSYNKAQEYSKRINPYCRKNSFKLMFVPVNLFLMLLGGSLLLQILASKGFPASGIYCYLHAGLTLVYTSILTYAIILQLILYRLLCSGYFDDMKSPEEIDEWSFFPEQQ